MGLKIKAISKDMVEQRGAHFRVGMVILMAAVVLEIFVIKYC